MTVGPKLTKKLVGRADVLFLDVREPAEVAASGKVPGALAIPRGLVEFRADPAYRGDGNRIDLAYAIHALAHGASEDTVGTTIQQRDLSKKGSEARQLAYVTRTLSKARQHLDTSRSR